MGTESLTARNKRSRSSTESLRITPRGSELRSPRKWSIALKTTAIITALTFVGSLGFAMSQGSLANQTGVGTAIAGDPRGQSPQSETLAMRASSSTCRPPIDWLAATPKFFSPCNPGVTRYIGAQRIWSADVNGDGTNESFDFAGGSGTHVLANGSIVAPSADDTAMMRTITVSDSSGVRLDEQTVFRVDVVAVGTAILQRFPESRGSQTIYFNWEGVSGWYDCDHDGDLDLVVFCTSPFPDGSRQIWFENTGYEKPALPVAADLNRDGRVDGADLGMLLIAWGPTN
jgi:hypothetical protein